MSLLPLLSLSLAYHRTSSVQCQQYFSIFNNYSKFIFNYFSFFFPFIINKLFYILIEEKKKNYSLILLISLFAFALLATLTRLLTLLWLLLLLSFSRLLTSLTSKVSIHHPNLSFSKQSLEYSGKVPLTNWPHFCHCFLL